MSRYNSTLGAMEFYTPSGWIPYGLITIDTVTPATYNGESGSLFTLTGSGFFSGSIVRFVTNSGTVYNAGVSTVVSATIMNATTPQDFSVADEPLDVQVLTPGGIIVAKLDCIDCGGTPSWSTAAGSLGTIYDIKRTSYAGTTVNATDPDTGATIGYSIVSGSLPSGMTFNTSTGAITGSPAAVVSDTVYSFTIRATDNAGNNTDRAFSYTVKAPVVTSFTSVGATSFSVPSGLDTVSVLVVAGGGGGGPGFPGYAAGGGGGAGGVIIHTTYPVSPGGSVPLNVGGGGAGNTGGGPSPGRGSSGSNSAFGAMTAFGGGGGGTYPIGSVGSGTPGGSGGGGGGAGEGTVSGGTATQTSNNGGTGYGYPGGSHTGTGQSNGSTSSGGGGGATSAGANGVANSRGGSGGNGYTWPGNGSTYGGGGGGGGGTAFGPLGSGGAGGPGGGGPGGAQTSDGSPTPGVSGTTNTGGGGGGGSAGGSGGPSNGANGASGIVIVKY
jgi:hypothetical protein